MEQKWNYQFNNNKIVVINGHSTALYINDQLQDEKAGVHMSVHLAGKLDSGETVIADIIGTFDEVKCFVHVDDLLLQEAESI